MISKKKAELTTQQIVMIIVLLTSFVILLVFLFKVNFQGTSEKEVCQSSIQLTGKTSFFGKIDCKTNYVCISGGGECKGFTSRETVNINLNDKSSKNKIMKALADKMVDCWWMFGEGKINYVDWKAFSTRVCAVCSEIAFDEKLISNKEFNSISYADFYSFLKTNYTNEDKTQTYFDYLQLIELNKLNEIYIDTGIFFNQKYGIYTGRDEKGMAPLPFSGSNAVVPPLLLDRTKSNLIGCKSFVTTP